MHRFIRFTIAIIALVCIFFDYSSLFAQACNGSPLLGGTGTPATGTVCQNYGVTLSVSGGTTTGISYQWEQSADSLNWVATGGGASTTYFVNYSINQNGRYYRRRVTCTNGGSIVYSSPIRINFANFIDCYCNAQSFNCNGGYTISNVSFASINNSTSGCPINGYISYVGTVAAPGLMQGSMLPVSVQVGTANTGKTVECFIDFDHSGSFDAPENTSLTLASGNVYSGYIRIPYHALTGNTRMRITYGSTATSSACYFYTSAETEDYLVDITLNTNPAAAGNVIYVKQTATGTDNSGRNWANAITNLQRAMQVAATGDTIKVAQGTYNSNTTTTAGNGYVLKDSVVMLGGYPATGTPTDANRNFVTYPTILSGLKSNNNGNYHVLYASGGMSNCRVDGFIIENGGSVEGITAAQKRGGGLSADAGANPTIRNCIFRNNFPYTGGGGTAFAINNAAPVFYNCVVAGNYNNGNYVTDSSTSNVILIANNSTPRFYNLLITGNRGDVLIYADSSNPIFYNSTIATNRLGKYIINAVDRSTISLYNSITYYNTTGFYPAPSRSFDTADVRFSNANVLVANSLTQHNFTGSNPLTGYQPKFKDSSNAAGADGVFFTADDGLSLSNPCSPAIDAGDNAFINNNLTDIIGSLRAYGNVPDIGAYEVQQPRGSIPATVYVKANATGLNDGSSWANAFTDFGRALQACSDTIKVAAGIYKPNNSGTQPFWLENKRIILGAYPATGNPGNADRNYSQYTTKFTDSAGIYSTGHFIVQGSWLDSTSVLDGITFSGVGFTGSGYNSFPITAAPLFYINCNNPIIRNCSFTNNRWLLFNGINNRNPQFQNCTITNHLMDDEDNLSSLDLFRVANSATTTFKNCRFVNNRLVLRTSTVGDFGKIFSITGSNPVFDSCVFHRNKANVLYNVRSNTIVRNSSFLNNYTGYNATDLKNENASPVVSNCVFRDSAWIDYILPDVGGIISNRLSNPMFTDCQFYNGKATRYGGIAYNDSSLARFTNCVFSSSRNAIHNTASSHIVLTNCIAINNETTTTYGSASFMSNVRSNPVLNNCTVVNNNSTRFGVVNNDEYSMPIINNCIFWKNFKSVFFDTANLNPRGDIYSPVSSQATVRNSSFEFFNGGTANANTLRKDPRFINIANPIGLDSIWFTADDGLRLCDCSPAINTGNNTYTTAAQDVTNAPRLYGTNIDRGAYELQTTPPVSVPITYYVNANAIGSNTGTSWADAYTNLYTAVNNTCADTIKIAEGVYKPAVLNRDSLFFINRNLVLQGSYDMSNINAATDVETHATILSGEIGSQIDSTDNSRGLITVSYADTVGIDGIVFSKTNNNVFVSTGVAPAAFSASTLRNLEMSNCRFYNNTNQNSGGAWSASSTRLTMRKCVFSQNVSASYGGGMSVGIGNFGKFTDCIFDNNTANAGGGLAGGGFCCGVSVSFINCLFNANKALYGGGMNLGTATSLQLINSTFSNNRCLNGVTRGIGIYSTGSVEGMSVSNTIFSGNIPIGQTKPQDSYQDIYAAGDGTNVYDATKASVHHSAVSTPPLTYSGGGNIFLYSLIQFKNPGNAKGPDNKWLTADDGLGLSICSGGIDAGQNSSTTATTDLAGRPRTVNGIIDMGAYEADGTPDGMKLLTTANDSLIANKEITSPDGWTHYYRDCYYLLSVQKRGQNIGTVGDGTFSVKIKTTPAYGSGTATNLSAASYVSPGVSWKVMNRYWQITSTATITDSLQVRFPYTATDFNDIKTANPAITTQQQMVFYKTNGTASPHSLTLTAANFNKYLHATAPTKSQWTFAALDTSSFTASYYVRSVSGGGGGGAMDTVCVSNTATWLGITPEWSVGSNWSTGQAPTVCTTAIVNTGVPFMPEVNIPNAACYRLTLNPGATITIRAGANLSIIGP